MAKLCYTIIKDNGVMAWMTILSTFKHYASFIKNPTFKDEKETRIVFLPNAIPENGYEDSLDNLSDLKTNILNHYSLGWLHDGVSALKSITIGSECTATEAKIRTILTNEGLNSDIPIKQSECTYRARQHYRDQVTAIRKQLGDTYEVDTVHKFQGREQDAIILTSVDNVITDFVDDPHMLNVAVSRAVHSLAVITSQDPRNDQTNYGDLARYIEYNNFEIIQSQIYSVFDMLYQGYAEQRREYLQKHKRVSEYDSENLMHSVIQEILSDEPFSSIGCAVHFSLATLVKDYAPLTEEERKYARNPLTHVDFLLFNQMDKQPVLAIEVDGGSHKSGSKQAERDAKKNSILDKCAIPLLRLRTDGSGEKEKIKNALKGE